MHVPLLLIVLVLATIAGILPFKAFLHIGMGMLLAVVLAALLACNVRADDGATNLDAQVILGRVLANLLMQDFSLKARLFVGVN